MWVECQIAAILYWKNALPVTKEGKDRKSKKKMRSLTIILIFCQLVFGNVPPTTGDLSVNFSLVSLVGTGSDLVGNFNLTNGEGTIFFNNKEYFALAYQYQGKLAKKIR
jgi:hypothetical protein